MHSPLNSPPPTSQSFERSTTTPQTQELDSRPRPKVPLIARCVLAVLALFVAALSSVPFALVPGVSNVLDGDNPWAIMAVTATATSIMLATYLLLTWALTRFVDGRPARAAGLVLDRRTLPAILAGTLLAVLITVFSAWLTSAIGLTEATTETSGTDPNPWIVVVLEVFLTAYIAQGIGEEFLFRGYLLQSARMRPVPALLLSAAVFAILHLVSTGGQDGIAQRFLYLFPTFAFALLAGALAVHFRSVWAACGIHGGMHVGFNLAMSMGLEMSTPWNWPIEGAIYLFVAVIAIALIPKSTRSQVLDPYV
nr:CAAX amino terminal protease self- immunity [Streptococcus thermophilus]